MPPLPLTTRLHTALPHLTAQARAVVSVLAAFNGHAPPAGELAAMRPPRRASPPRSWNRSSAGRSSARCGGCRDTPRPTGRPFDVVIGRNQTAYVTRASAASVACVLLDPLRAGGSVPTGAVPTRLVLSKGGNRAYVTNQFTEDIGVIDLQRSRQIGAIAVPGHRMAVVLSRDGRTLFVTTNLDHLYAIPLGTGSAMACAAVTERLRRDGLDPSGTRLYVPTWRAGDRARGRAAGPAGDANHPRRRQGAGLERAQGGRHSVRGQRGWLARRHPAEHGGSPRAARLRVTRIRRGGQP